MDISVLWEELRQQWLLRGRHDLLQQLNEAPMGANTGSEGAGMRMNFFRMIKATNPEAYQEIEAILKQIIQVYREKHDLSFYI